MNVKHWHMDNICIVIIICSCVVINLHYKIGWIYPYNGTHALMCSYGCFLKVIIENIR